MNERMESQQKIAEIREQFVNHKFRHFKGGIYVVTDLTVHSETADIMVIYHSDNDPSLGWCREFKMFTSEVDREKYPEVAQKMRFEKID